MIYNERQQKVTIIKLAELKKALTATKARNDIDDFAKNLHLATIEGVINDLDLELSEYACRVNGE